MGKIIHVVLQSLDGYIEGPEGEFYWPTKDMGVATYMRQLTEDAGTLLYGRATWDFMSDYWPYVEQRAFHPNDVDFAPVWRAKPKAVVSRTLDHASWDAGVFHDIESLAEATAYEHGTFLLCGGSELASALARHGLIDEFHIFIHPVMLGGGRPVFTDVKVCAALRLVESRVLDNQIVLLRHERLTSGCLSSPDVMADVR
ncbi:dihydrofolate reductase [Nocardia sp. SYP-A9097]|uniref:dihydrofolate reductase family protein n=1 Tax=Nocardia sp. SYP-A9097 TaxID=2663237 RepID=UPI00129A2643|nr:dihydrofolate reductase family protein [Nocardia sp. SYP-A9097]MRH87640.1 dihydrofolate reductase [Nocardia sp. SYP-A9097]